MLEIILGGIIPAAILITEKWRKNPGLFITAIFLAVIGGCVNRWVMVLQVLAVPVMPFDNWAMYVPSWQEVATTLLPLMGGIILVSLSYRYLPIFPQEEERSV